MTAAEVLRAAKAELVTHGWCQGSLVDGNGRLCARGALVSVPIRDGASWAADMGAAVRLLAMVCAGVHEDTITSFNDRAGRTVEEVLAKFDEAIDEAEVSL